MSLNDRSKENCIALIFSNNYESHLLGLSLDKSEGFGIIDQYWEQILADADMTLWEFLTGEVDLAGNSKFTGLPDYLHFIDADLDFSHCHNLTALPDPFHVTGGLKLVSCSSLEALPKKMIVGGTLNLRGSSVITMPTHLEVGGNLEMYYSDVTSLPDNMIVGCNFYLESSRELLCLPENLQVGGDLDISDTNITVLPDSLKVGGKVIKK